MPSHPSVPASSKNARSVTASAPVSVSFTRLAPGHLIAFLLAGVAFGVVLTKAELLSWFRIQEMFRFQAFHMYGVIGSAVALGALIVFVVKKFQLKTFNGRPITFADKQTSVPRYLYGGIIFGAGWALTGACPGPLFALVGYGYGPMLVVLGSVFLGTFVYGLVRNRLPH